MIRRLLCWLGFHEWEHCCDYCQRENKDLDCVDNCNFPLHNFICKHCRKVKR